MFLYFLTEYFAVYNYLNMKFDHGKAVINSLVDFFVTSLFPSSVEVVQFQYLLAHSWLQEV